MPVFEDWTRVQWWILHTFSAFFPDQASDEKRKEFVEAINKWAGIFPCPSCGQHFKQYLEKNPLYPATESTQKLKRYFYDFHEAVNQKRGKPTVHTFEEVDAAFTPGHPWLTFGGYPISNNPMIVTTALNPTDISETASTPESNINIYGYLTAIIVLSAFLLAAIIVAVYSSLRYRKLKSLQH